MCPDHEKLLALWNASAIRYASRMAALIRRDCKRGVGCSGYE